ncbi:hypothetical protein [Acuticoccus sediminis]|nr:hypothetical protein [Acuticoccus sediminis]
MPDHENGYPATKARQGEIILKHRRSRLIVIASLGGAAALALLSALWA